jgi:hypothetical protein
MFERYTKYIQEHDYFLFFTFKEFNYELKVSKKERNLDIKKSTVIVSNEDFQID